MADFNHLQSVMRGIQTTPELTTQHSDFLGANSNVSSGYSSMNSSKNSTLQRASPETPTDTVYRAKCSNVGNVGKHGAGDVAHKNKKITSASTKALEDGDESSFGFSELHLQPTEPDASETPAKNKKVPASDKTARVAHVVFPKSCGVVGLKNLGNTCFMNSIIQCLNFATPVAKFSLLELYSGATCPRSRMKGNLIKELGLLVQQMWSASAAAVVTPKMFKTQIGKFAPRFMGYNQQDAHEFLRFLLDGLHDEINRVHVSPKYSEHPESLAKEPLSVQLQYYTQWYRARNDSFILDQFGGLLRSTLRCSCCHHEWSVWDPFCDLSLPLTETGAGAGGYSAYDHRAAPLHLRDLLARFVSEEVLEGDEMPKCPACNKRQTCTKQLSIETLPPILVVHIKRFAYNAFGGRGRKVTTEVDFPLDGLDLSLRGGHYTAHCRHPASGAWHELDDRTTRRIDAGGTFSEPSVAVPPLSRHCGGSVCTLLPNTRWPTPCPRALCTSFDIL
eukprot:m.396395 g.396395  ORF g.396395 m.396395 type:complete len:504 (-) comp21109_c0_seq9:154-1665(-)